MDIRAVLASGLLLSVLSAGNSASAIDDPDPTFYTSYKVREDVWLDR